MFKKLVSGWTTRRQKAEAEDFLRRIRVADGEELGMTVAMVLTTAEMFRAALMVWTHSLRGIENFEVRTQAREIWSHLSRGFPYAHEGAQLLEQATGMEADLSNLGRFPSGLNPTVS